MMYPILCKVRYESLHHVFRERGIWIQIGFSIFVNWIIAPFLMVRVIQPVEVSMLMLYIPAGTGMGFPAGRARTSGGLDSRWISQMHCYGRSNLFSMLSRIRLTYSC